MKIVTKNDEIRIEKQLEHRLNQIVYDKVGERYCLIVYNEETKQYGQVDLNTGIYLCTVWDSLEEMSEKCTEDYFVESYIKIVDKGES